MPSSYLKKSTVLLHRQTVAVHGEPTVRAGGRYAWFPAAEAGTEYTVAIPGTVMKARQRGMVVKGLSSMETGEIALACKRTDLPFFPVPNVTVFIVAEAEASGTGLVPSATRQRYVVTEVNERIHGTTSLRIVASLNA